MLPPHYYLVMLMAALTMVLLRGRRMFDDVLEALHRTHPEEYAAEGRPFGFFWRPEDSAPFAEGTRARSLVFRKYMRAVPPWMQDNEALMLKLLWARIYLSLSYIGFFATGIGLLVMQFG